jgi:PhzF family phenazine biosynthesis protein
MKLPLYQIDAFTSSLSDLAARSDPTRPPDAAPSRMFTGNPAAVCPLDRWLDDALMQSIAAENNLSETAFIVRTGPDYAIRWFTPTVEVDLCGHATLASAFVVFESLEPARAAVTFASKSGPLIVTRDGKRLRMDFPSRSPSRCAPPETLRQGLRETPVEVWKSTHYLAVYNSEAEVRALEPDMERLKRLDVGVIVTAPTTRADFVSRFFAPGAGVPEDPVTGSAHCTLVPYWSQRLGKTQLHALQVSRRGGELFCEHRGERVTIAGRAVKYLEGTIEV